MNIPQDILEIHRRFKAAGKKLFVVGGSVRDHLMGRTPKDFDMATDAMPNETENILYGYNLDFTGKSFGVMRVYTLDTPKGYEIATFRQDISTGRNPEVKLGVAIDVDVLRRDLTINALFFDIDTQEVVDLVGGKHDIDNGIIRTPGNPKDRFNEDKLRILRAIRFAARFGFQFDKQTWKAIKEDNRLVGPDKGGNQVPLSQERITEEFLKACDQCNMSMYLDFVKDADLFKQIFPDINVETFVWKTAWSDNQLKPEVVMATLMFHELARIATLTEHRKFLHHLVQVCKFPIKMINGVILLLKLIELTPDTAYPLKKSMETNNLTSDDIMEYLRLNDYRITSPTKDFIRAFCRYEIQTLGDDMITKEGYKEGIEMGIELRKRERAIFDELLK